MGPLLLTTHPVLHPYSYRRVFSLAWPVLLANIAHPLLGLVDTAVVGHLDSERYLAGVALGSSLMSFVFWGFNFLAMGISGFTSQSRGASRLDECSLILKKYLLVWLFLSCPLLLISPLLIDWSLGLMSVQEEVKEQAAIYLSIRSWGIPAILLTITINGWFLGLANTKIALIASLCSQGLNIILDLLFVLVFGMKTEGIALGTVIAEYASACLLMYFVLRTFSNHDWSWLNHKWASLTHNLQDVFKVSHQLFVRTFVLLFVIAYFNALSGSISSSLLAANAVLAIFITIISSSLDGFSAAAETLSGQAIGSKQKPAFRQVVETTGILSLLLAVFLTLVFWLLGPILINLLTNQPEIRALANQYLGYVVLMPALAFISYWLDGIFIGCRLTTQMRNVIVLSFILGFLPARFGFEAFFGSLNGHLIWICFCLFTLLRTMLMSVTFYNFYRRLKL